MIEAAVFTRTPSSIRVPDGHHDFIKQDRHGFAPQSFPHWASSVFAHRRVSAMSAA
ncbi:MAG: hypothetical protein NTV08_14130 [Verrucomicrobia bacterium]|nr:hypothetical protein [Verrucomicrobiota bacterium]